MVLNVGAYVLLRKPVRKTGKARESLGFPPMKGEGRFIVNGLIFVVGSNSVPPEYLPKVMSDCPKSLKSYLSA